MIYKTLEEATEGAERLDARAEVDGVQLAYDELSLAIEAFENGGYPIDAIIPTGASPELGFSFTRADGRNFFDIYADLIRDSLCEEGGEFNEMVESKIDVTVGSILAVVVAALGLPMVALGIVVPIVVLIARTGLDAFCELSDPEAAFG